MAKQVRGARANKPNDSFGTINSDTLYKGNYREDVYKDDDDTPEVEASEDTDQPESTSFVETTQEKPDHDYKKRYDDLKRHYDAKLAEFQAERQQLEAATKQANVPMPKTVEELEEFKAQYPDVYGVVETVAAMQASERTNELQKELEVIKEREKETVVQAAYRELTANHPDFDTIKSDDKFLAWLQEQPESISDGIYKNNTDARWASRVLDLYKADAGISKKKTSRAKNDAATSVRAPKARDIVAEQGGEKRIWKSSEIRSLKPWEFERLEEELDAARQEGRIDPNN
jgi:hypothetical protein|tara:strand:- start:59 stop:922 length:864 start_codon:yes stop_codon:yes gene_type:complete